ncbi:tRNA 2-thiouridine(34) synthase MnmA [Geobacter sp. DSM 9736]|uniref:tRNA 2-thiouridine(34) synthase MnmA n=1 Tax=Geobacter sp. DSM 9736 TaxID=1277350 RepID=UPI000B50A41B|nr:tRNA 2-thiouridine(34) synthase MnmA [Geobacter sp. DSM 9736]SNB44859.1 tRNA (5-methylaminomethyl-2-thiouridylate)-methyltransferase [Geobacter sp. DSM 9736]
MNNARPRRVVVAMSGGVDSSVTAALLREQGHEVIGISMQLWDHSDSAADENFGSCCSLDDLQDARRVAEQLDIPFYVVNFEEEFRRIVVEDFVDEYFRGRTPNPCVRCNQVVKFELLLAKARGLGADCLATGHYARIAREDGNYRLLKGVDPQKDQSYFLFALTPEQMASTLFPLGELTKQEVRRLAAHYGLRVAEKGESQEICFIPDDDYVRFLEEERGTGLLSGKIVDRRGNVLGTHDGIYRYTVGQRKGLGIAHAHPLYVVGVDAERCEVVVGAKDELLSRGVIAEHMNWIVPPHADPMGASCKIRYRHQPVPCVVRPLAGGGAEVLFGEPQRAVTPGQAVVLYDGDSVLGGGWITAGIE